MCKILMITKAFGEPQKKERVFSKEPQVSQMLVGVCKNWVLWKNIFEKCLIDLYRLVYHRTFSSLIEHMYTLNL